MLSLPGSFKLVNSILFNWGIFEIVEKNCLVFAVRFRHTTAADDQQLEAVSTSSTTAVIFAGDNCCPPPSSSEHTGCQRILEPLDSIAAMSIIARSTASMQCSLLDLCHRP